MIYSALSLIATFLCASVLCILQNNDFLGFMILIAYIGAIIVLILFVVMLFHEEKPKEMLAKGEFAKIFIKTFFLGLFLSAVAVLAFSFKPSQKAWDLIAFPRSKELSNVQSIGNVLYTDYVLPFQISGFILLAAMIGCIVLVFDRYQKKNPTQTDMELTKVKKDEHRKVLLINPKLHAGLNDIKVIERESE